MVTAPNIAAINKAKTEAAMKDVVADPDNSTFSDALALTDEMTAAALANISMIGAILIFCVGLNLVWGKKVRVANMLPAIIIAVAAAFLPI